MESGICPECKNSIQPGWTFCDNCGKPLQNPASDPARINTPAYIPTPNLAPYSEVEQPIPSLPVGSLEILNRKISLPIPQGTEAATIGREDTASNSHPEINLDPYGGHEVGVGRQHARLVMDAGQLCLIDLNSVNGSYINRKKITPGEPYPIHDGDEIRLGRMKMIYHAG